MKSKFRILLAASVLLLMPSNRELFVLVLASVGALVISAAAWWLR